MGDESEKRLTLRLSEDLAEQLQIYANDHKLSLNSAILTAIEQMLSGKKQSTVSTGFLNFDQRNLIGQIVESKNIDTATGIITVKGLVYRYITENNRPVRAGSNYQVTNINGNIVIIKESEK